MATAYHLFSGFADDNCEHSVTVFDGRRISAELVAIDEPHDLAILQLSTTRALNELPLQRVRDVQVEDLALAFSYASGPGNPPLMTTGRVINERYACINTLGLGAGDGILVDTDVNPGFSGSPIVNAHGEVIGVITGSREGFFMATTVVPYLRHTWSPFCRRQLRNNPPLLRSTVSGEQLPGPSLLGIARRERPDAYRRLP